MRKTVRRRRVLIVTGRSGGHIFPAVSILERICSVDGAAEAVIVIPDCAALPAAESGCPGRRSVTLPYPGPALRRVLQGYSVLLYLPLIFIKSLFFLLYFRPDAVAGFGSICSVPMVFLARLLGIGTLIHEQNVIPGKATLFLSRFADRIAVSFPATAGYLGEAGAKAVLTGNPLRSGLRRIDRKEALDFFGLDAGKFTVLVTGGSQGSSRINGCFVRAVKLLKEREKFQVVHLTGRNDYDPVKEAYAGCGGLDARVFEFFSSMEYAYSAADLIIARAGAMTVSEVIYYGIPAVIVPYPFAGAHQDANAAVLKQCLRARVVADSAVSAEFLRAELENALSRPREAGAGRGEDRDAAGLVAEEIISLTCR